MNYVVTCNTPNAVTKEKVQKATDEDTTLLALKRCIHQGCIDAKAENLQVYKHVFSELAVVDGIVVRGDRIVVPETLRQRMVEIAREGHQGQVRTKQLLRAHVSDVSLLTIRIFGCTGSFVRIMVCVLMCGIGKFQVRGHRNPPEDAYAPVHTYPQLFLSGFKNIPIHT